MSVRHKVYKNVSILKCVHYYFIYMYYDLAVRHNISNCYNAISLSNIALLPLIKEIRHMDIEVAIPPNILKLTALCRYKMYL